jgi:hypothetical protein
MSAVMRLNNVNYRRVKNLLKVAKRNSALQDYLVYRNYGQYPPIKFTMSNLLQKDKHTPESLILTYDFASEFLRVSSDKKCVLRKYNFTRNRSDE